jgi:hypothetical protein
VRSRVLSAEEDTAGAEVDSVSASSPPSDSAVLRSQAEDAWKISRNIRDSTFSFIDHLMDSIKIKPITQGTTSLATVPVLSVKVKLDSVVVLWEVLASDIDSLQMQTRGVHRYFDAGEIQVSYRELLWLNENAQKLGKEILKQMETSADSGRKSKKRRKRKRD